MHTILLVSSHAIDATVAVRVCYSSFTGLDRHDEALRTSHGEKDPDAWLHLYGCNGTQLSNNLVT